MKMDKLMKQAQKMQAQMMKMQEELAHERVEGSKLSRMGKETLFL